jgi:hypothetical protein
MLPPGDRFVVIEPLRTAAWAPAAFWLAAEPGRPWRARPGAFRVQELAEALAAERPVFISAAHWTALCERVDVSGYGVYFLEPDGLVGAGDLFKLVKALGPTGELTLIVGCGRALGDGGPAERLDALGRAVVQKARAALGGRADGLAPLAFLSSAVRPTFEVVWDYVRLSRPERVPARFPVATAQFAVDAMTAVSPALFSRGARAVAREGIAAARQWLPPDDPGCDLEVRARLIRREAAVGPEKYALELQVVGSQAADARRAQVQAAAAAAAPAYLTARGPLGRAEFVVAVAEVPPGAAEGEVLAELRAADPLCGGEPAHLLAVWRAVGAGAAQTFALTLAAGQRGGAALAAIEGSVAGACHEQLVPIARGLEVYQAEFESCAPRPLRPEPEAGLRRAPYA